MGTLWQTIARSSQQEPEMITLPETTGQVLVHSYADVPTRESPPIDFAAVLSFTGEVYWRA